MKKNYIKWFLPLIIMAILWTSIGADSRYLFNLKRVYNSVSLYKEQDTMLKKLNEKYKSFTQIKVIGKTAQGRDIVAFKIGKGEKSVMINGSHHARENMTTILIMNQIEALCSGYANGLKYNGRTYKNILDSTAIWFVPNVNPDGVEIARSYNIKNNAVKYPSFVKTTRDKKYIKSNARGVDLNRNYDANWDNIFDRAEKPGIWSYYPGDKPFSEPETIAIRDFCREMDFNGTIAYHATGQIIFWHFGQSGEAEKRDELIAKDIKKLTGYTLVPKWYNLTNKGLVPNNGQYSGGGFKDWFITEFEKPSYTIEIGKAAPPLGQSEYAKIWKDNKFVPIYFADKIDKVFSAKKTVKEGTEIPK